MSKLEEEAKEWIALMRESNDGELEMLTVVKHFLQLNKDMNKSWTELTTEDVRKQYLEDSFEMLWNPSSTNVTGTSPEFKDVDHTGEEL